MLCLPCNFITNVEFFFYDTCILTFRSEQLRRGVYDMGFNKPSKIQETALPMLLADPLVWCYNAVINNLLEICGT